MPLVSAIARSDRSNIEYIYQWIRETLSSEKKKTFFRSATGLFICDSVSLIQCVTVRLYVMFERL